MKSRHFVLVILSNHTRHIFQATTLDSAEILNMWTWNLTKAHIAKAMAFPVVMYGCKGWTINKGWAPKNWCFRAVVWEETLESPLDSKEIKSVNPKGNQPWLFIGRTDAEAEAPIVGHLMWRANSLEKTLMLGKIEGRRRWWQRIRWLDVIIDSMDMRLSKLWEIVKDTESWHTAVDGVTKCRTWLSNWTTMTSW